MQLIVCVCDYDNCRHYFNRRITIGIPMQSGDEGKKHLKPNYVRRLQLELDAVSGNYMLRELLHQQVLRNYLLDELNIELLWLKLRLPKRQNIDFKWFYLLTQMLKQHIELEQLMCWLSTLGGGYSALGDQFERCAQAAGEISLQQLNIGLRLGNRFLQSRCKLFYSISLIQRGQLRQAKYLIRAQYRFAFEDAQNNCMLPMCAAIWQRLCYEYEKRQKLREVVKRF